MIRFGPRRIATRLRPYCGVRAGLDRAGSAPRPGRAGGRLVRGADLGAASTAFGGVEKAAALAFYRPPIPVAERDRVRGRRWPPRPALLCLEGGGLQFEVNKQ